MTFTDILDQFNIPYLQSGHHHCTQGFLQLDCPHCSQDSKHWRLGYNLKGRFFSCWTCGFLSFGRTVCAILDQPWHVVEPLIRDIRPSRDYQEKIPSRLQLPPNIEPMQAAHKRYLSKRGFDPNEIEALWGVKGIGISQRLAWRLWIPVTKNYRLTSWTTRSLSDEGLRYISAKAEEEEYPLRQTLYGEDHCQLTVIVCEGPLDAWTIGPGAVATCGIGYSRAQLRKIAKYPQRFVVFDAEKDAQQRARKLCDDLSVFPGSTTNLVLSTGKDPSRASKQEVLELQRRLK